MNTQQLNTILDKYWEGQTSQEEEHMLRSYFKQDSVAPEHEEYQALFVAMSSSAHYRPQSLMDQDALMKLAQTIPSETRVVTLSWIRYARVAAVAAFLVVAGWVVMDQIAAPRTAPQASTMETPEEALEQSRAALLYVSSVLNKGLEASEELNHLKSINHVIPGSL